MKNYQADYRYCDGTLSQYKIIRANTLMHAALLAIGESGFPHYTISRSRLCGHDMITARYPEFTSEYIEIIPR
jgi:predicted urease superfamily metal-dependent hydrolase